MTELFAIGGIVSALGLSSAAGLNAALPLLAIGVLGRTGHLELAPGYRSLSSWPVLALLAVIFVVDVVGDKVPAVDHVLHLVGLVAYPVAGAIAAASQSGAVAHTSTAVMTVVGFVLAGGLHVGRSTVRPVSTVATGGIANPLLSAGEDATSLGLTASAVLVPALALVLVVLVVGAMAWLALRVRRSVRRVVRRSVTTADR